MLEKFYLDILEETLKKHKDFESYKEELEKKTDSFQNNINLLFDNPNKNYSEAQANANQQKKEQGNQTATQPVQLPDTDIHKIALGAEFATQAVLFSYTIAGMAEWFMEPETQQAYKGGANNKKGVTLKDKSLRSLMSKAEGLGASKNNEVIPYTKIFNYNLNDGKLSLQNRSLIFLFQTNQYGIKDLTERNTDQTVREMYVQEAYKKINEYIATNEQSETTFRSFLNRFITSHSDEAANLYRAQIKNSKIDSQEEMQNFYELLIEQFPNAKRFESFHLGESQHETASMYNVIQMLAETGLLQPIMDAVYQGFSRASTSLVQKMNEASQNVFEKYQRLTSPIKNESVEDAIDNTFKKYMESNYKNFSKDEIYSMYLEGVNQLPDSANADNPKTAPTTYATTQTKPGAVPQIKQEIKTPEPNTNEIKTQQTQPQQPSVQQTQYNSASKSEAQRQVIIMLLMGLMATTMQSLQRIAKNSMAGLLEEVNYTEGLLSFIHKTADNIASQIFKGIKNFTGMPTDIMKLASNQQLFQQTIQSLINKSNSGSLQNVLKNFNFSQILQQMDERVFNVNKLKEPKVKSAITSEATLNKLSDEITKSLNSISTTDLQKMLEAAFDSQASPELQRARKIVGKVQNLATKFRV